MRQDMFTVNNTIIDYNLLGRFPKDFEKLKFDKILDKFIECFEYTFTNTVFSYYGDLKEIKELLDASIIFEKVEATKYSKTKQWEILLLIVEKMFLDMHATLLGCETIDLILDNLEHLDEEDLKILIEDINLAIYFAIEENILVTPTSLKELNATCDDIFLLEDILRKEEEFEKIISNCKAGNKINKSKYEEIIGKPYNVKMYKKSLFNKFLFQWIDLMGIPDMSDLSEEKLEEIYSDIFATILTFFTMFFDEDNDVYNLTEEIYFFISKIFNEKYGIEPEEEI